MRRIAVALLAVILTVSTALAANPHFVGDVRLTDRGTTLNVRGSIAGLGNENIDVIVEATGIAEVQCRNPGGNIAPGQDTTVNVTGSANDIRVKNGRASFNITTNEPTVGSEACPNRQWTAEVIDVDFESATITVIQPAGSGNVVLQETFQL